jgi:monoamine oxidase
MASTVNEAADTVVIVGGGIGGLYTAWKLAEGGTPVAIYEATGRLGGRIETVDLEPDFKAEMGPMRFELALQPNFEMILSDTKDSDGNPVQPAPFASPRAPRLPDRDDLAPDERPDGVPLDGLGLMQLGLFRLFGIEHTVAIKYTDADGGAKEENGAPITKDTPGAVKCAYVKPSQAAQAWLRSTRDPDVPMRPGSAAPESTYDDVRATAHVPGQPSRLLRDEGLWNALYEVLSPGAVAAIHQLGPFFHFLPENLSAVEWGIFWLRYFHPDESQTKMKTINEGTIVVVKHLEAELKRHGATVNLNHEAVAIRPVIDGTRVEVEFCVDGAATRMVESDRVVLAIPRKPLELVAAHFPDHVARHLGDVNAFPMVKVFFVFPTPAWWKALPKQIKAQEGASRLPTREVHYFPPFPAKPAAQTMVLLYTDRPATAFWQHLLTRPDHHHQAERAPRAALPGRQDAGAALRQQLAIVLTKLEIILMQELCGRGATSPEDERSVEGPELEAVVDWSEEVASLPTRSAAWNATALAFKRLREIGADYRAAIAAQQINTYAIRDWSRMPYGAASHCWVPGANSIEVREKFSAFALKGQPKENVHIVGEAYSDYQGFIEGALRSAELALAKISASQAAA